MTREDVVAATREAVRAAEQVAAHLERLRDRLRPLFPLQAEQVAAWDDDPRERLHAFLRLFEQMYDLVGRRLMRGLLLLSGEDPSALSANNRFRRIEALHPGFSADRWMALGITRNRLVHEYPTDAAAQARNGADSWRDLPDLLENTRAIVAALRLEGFVE